MRALTWFVVGANAALLAGNVVAYHRLRVLRRRWKEAMRWWARPDVKAIAERESEGGADGLKAHWRSMTPNPERPGAGESERTRWTI